MDEIRTWSSIVITYEAANLVSDNGAAPKSTETTSPLANQNPDTASTSPAHSVARRPSGLKKVCVQAQTGSILCALRDHFDTLHLLFDCCA